MLIPLGTSLKRSRLPVVTLAIIGLNAAVFWFSHPLAGEDDRKLSKVAAQLATVEQEIEFHHLGDEGFEKRYVAGLFGKRTRTQERFWDDYAAGRIEPAESSEFQHWLVARVAFERGRDAHVFYRFGFRVHPFRPFTLLSSMFLHAGYLHIIGNMWFLWIVGANMEDVWGRAYFLLLYLTGGLIATASQALAAPASELPCLGASGAVAAVMGAFMVRHFSARIRFYSLLVYIGPFSARAGLLLPLWLGLQFKGAIDAEPGQGGVAFWAHIGGFLLGAGLGFGVKLRGVEEAVIRPRLEREDRERAKAEALATAGRERERGASREELAALEAAATADPADSELRLTLFERYRTAGDTAKVGVIGLDLLRLLWQAGARARYVEVFEALRELTPAPALGPGLLYRAALALEKEAPQRAAALLYELAERHPDDPVARQALPRYADLLDRMGHPKRAAQVRSVIASRGQGR